MDLMVISIPYAIHLAALVIQPSLIFHLDPMMINERRQVAAEVLDDPTRIIPITAIFLSLFAFSVVSAIPVSFRDMISSLMRDLGRPLIEPFFSYI